MKNLVRQKADNLPVIAPYTVTTGQGVLVGALFGFASNDALINTEVTIVRRGEFTHTKIGTQAWIVGQKIYWDDTNRRLTNVSSGNTYVGIATKAVGSGAGETTGQIVLVPGG